MKGCSKNERRKIERRELLQIHSNQHSLNWPPTPRRPTPSYWVGISYSVSTWYGIRVTLCKTLCLTEACPIHEGFGWILSWGPSLMHYSTWRLLELRRFERFQRDLFFTCNVRWLDQISCSGQFLVCIHIALAPCEKNVLCKNWTMNTCTLNESLNHLSHTLRRNDEFLPSSH